MKKYPSLKQISRSPRLCRRRAAQDLPQEGDVRPLLERLLPHSSTQVQPRPLYTSAFLCPCKTRLKIETLEHKLVQETASHVPVLEGVICSKNAETAKLVKRVEQLEASKERLRRELGASRALYSRNRGESQEGERRRLSLKLGWMNSFRNLFQPIHRSLLTSSTVRMFCLSFHSL